MKNSVNVLFVSPTDLLSPLLHSQGIPHMRQLAKLGYSFTLLTFEKANWSDEERARADELKEKLARWKVEWHYVRNATVPFLPNSTANIAKGLLPTLTLVRKKKIDIVHCRSYMPTFMMLILRLFTRAKFIFDVRGFYPEEMVKSGSWTRNSPFFKVSKVLEKKAFLAADAIVVVTRRQNDGVTRSFEAMNVSPETFSKLFLIPNCADTEKFAACAATREEMRHKFSLVSNTVFIWVVGGVRGVHLPLQVLDFYKAAKTVIGNAHLIVLTQTRDFSETIKARGIDDDAFHILSVSSENVPKYLQMADVGLAFIDPAHEDIGIKFAEYLASGLPVVTNRCHQEWDSAISSYRAGIVVEDLSEEGYKVGAQELIRLLSSREDYASRCTALAHDNYSLKTAVQRYSNVYKHVL
jgi:glycosyltransferase involved in cell wall biosynthesis